MRDFEQLLLYAGIACEAALVMILWLRGILRRLPVFSGYVTWMIFSDVAAAVLGRGSQITYFHFYRVELIADSVLQLLVLVELARSALRPLPVLVGRGVSFLLMVMLLGAGAVLWHLAGRWSLSAAWTPEWFFLLRVQLTAALLRIVLLLLLGGMVELLGRNLVPIGWGDRELQVATGIGVYALASLAGGLRLCYPLSGRLFEWVDFLQALTFLGVLVYWIVSFLIPEQPTLAERAAFAVDCSRGVSIGTDSEQI